MDFVVALPPGWVRIPLDGREKARAAALATAKTAQLAQAGRRAARQKLATAIRNALNQAYTAGGIDILLSLAEYNGIPVIASCLVTYAEHGTPVPLDDLARELSGQRTGEVTALQVAEHPGVRHLYTEDLMTRIDYHTCVPGRTGLITFAFSAPTGPLADANRAHPPPSVGVRRWPHDVGCAECIPGRRRRTQTGDPGTAVRSRNAGNGIRSWTRWFAI